MASSGATPRPRIVIADDDAGMRLLLAEIVRQAGYSPILCGDGPDAYAVAVTGRNVLLILDWDMPRLSGPDVLARLRDDGVCTPALLVSARADSDAALLALLAPIRFLRKPFSVEEVRREIRGLLEPARPPLHERRTSRRIGLQGLGLDLGPPLKGRAELTDISEGGAGLVAGHAADVGDRMALPFSHPLLRSLVLKQSQVRWVRLEVRDGVSRYRLGLAFSWGSSDR
ncbi:MAG TPA: response regulator [Planctomycetota bacterium]|nr:response regulator [Planctomycetota bacterium]